MYGFAVKTLLKVDQSQNKNMTYQYGRSKTNENETITEYIAGVCVWSMYTEATQSSTYVTMCNSIVLKRFSVDIRKAWKR